MAVFARGVEVLTGVPELCDVFPLHDVEHLQADGYTVTLVEAQPGYAGSPHEHAHAEFNYVIAGTLRNQGREMSVGDGYAAAAGSTHTDFATETGATYLVIFKL